MTEHDMTTEFALPKAAAQLAGAAGRPGHSRGALRWWHMRCALAALTCVAACADPAPADKPESKTDVAADTQGLDVFVEPDEQSGGDTTAADTTGSDLSVLPDTAKTDAPSADAADGNGCPGAAGCPCKQNDECESNYCLDTPDGQVCGKKCTDNVCPAGFKCGTVSVGGGDLASICLPQAPNLCNPCVSNTQCQSPGNSGARCVDTGQGGAFCGIACSGVADCPEGYECKDANDISGQTSKQCVVKDGAACSCSPAALKNEAYTTCFKTVGSAKCSGKRICLADGKPGAPKGGGLTACLADAPEAESCDGKDNDCDGQTDEAACEDNNPCTDDTCDPKQGCSHINNQALCDADGSVCTKDDYCINGKCLTGKIQNCDDNNVCTDDACDPKLGCKHDNNTVGCDFDDNPCTVGDACKEGKCIAGPAKACDSGNQCVVGKCSIVGADAGKCKYDYKEGLPCEDGNACTTSDACKGDVCSGAINKCDDGNSCTNDTCDSVKGCAHSPNSDPCEDGDKCTQGDKCGNGACNGSAIDPVKTCTDNNPCTADTCNSALGCVNKPLIGAACDDANSCSVGDKCDDKGQCQSGTNTCACDTDAQCIVKLGDNLCNGTPFCDKSGALTACKYKPNTAVVCDVSSDGVCKKTLCEPATGQCKPQFTLNGIPCDADGSVCTVDDACKDGACTKGKAQDCNDNKPCTADTCDAKTGCAHQNLVGDCDADGNACTQGDACKDGACIPGTAKLCNDNEPCTDDSCNKTDGSCVYAQSGKSCSDSNECTVGDKCGTDPKTSKYTCVPGAAPNCDDANPCTIDSCDIAKPGGCTHVVDNGAQQVCYSGAPATQGKGICKPGVKTCDAQGVLGPCQGEVTPAASDPCDGLDNDCNGVADPGCAPGTWSARFGNAAVSGAGPTGTLTSYIGVSNVGGLADSTTWKVNFGLAAWLKAWLGK